MKKIYKTLFALMLACLVSNSASAETKKGDVNGDNQVTIADVTALVNVILGKTASNAACDVNGDTIISIADVTALVNIILGKTPSATDSSDIVDDPPAWEPANAPKRHADDGQDDNNGNNAKTREQRKLRK